MSLLPVTALSDMLRRVMSESLLDLPEVEPQDPESVAVAIETARALFRTGERMDALRWLRRAAERAEEAGDDLRALNLARCAADLSTELQSSVPPAPPTSRQGEAVALAPYDDFSDKTVVDVPGATALLRDALQSGVQITEINATSLSPRSVTMPSPSSSPAPAGPRNTLKAEPESVKVNPRQAYRVAIARDPETAGTWLMRLLPDGVPAAPGSEEALVVVLDPKSKLFQ